MGSGNPLSQVAKGVGDVISNASNGINSTLDSAVGQSTNWQFENSGDVLNNELNNQIDALTTAANAYVNIASGGLAGVDKNGRLQESFNAEVIGEITGRNAQRKSNMDSAEALRNEAAAREQERLFKIKQQEANERKLSGKSRKQAGLGSGNTVGGIASIEQQAAADFLGL